MLLKEKTIISTATLAGTLLAYWLAKTAHKDAAPAMLLGSFAGSVLGEILAEAISKNNS